MLKPVSFLENETLKILWYLHTTTDLPITARRPDLVLINKKKRTYQLEGFADPPDHRGKIKESEKIDKYSDQAIVIGALGAVPQVIEKMLGELGVRGRSETLRNTALIRSARIYWRVLETRGDSLSHKIQCKTMSKN